MIPPLHRSKADQSLMRSDSLGHSSRWAHHANIGPWMELSPSLTNDDVTRDAVLPAIQFHAQHLRLGVLGVLG